MNYYAVTTVLVKYYVVVFLIRLGPLGTPQGKKRRSVWSMVCQLLVVRMKHNLSPNHGSPKPVHLKPGHLKMAFFTALFRLDGAFPVQTARSLSRRRFPCGISLERAARIDVSSANCRAKSHFQVRTSELGRREKTPTPKTRVSIWTLLRTPDRFTIKPLPMYLSQRCP